MSETIKTKETWTVVHGRAIHGGAGQGDAASATDCYHDRAPYGEYILYAASDPGSFVDGKITISDYRYLVEVRVTFEDDLVADGEDDIGWCQSDYEEMGDAFVRQVWPSWQDVTLGEVAGDIFPEGQDYVMAKSVLGVGEDSASWVEVTRIEADQPAEMAICYSAIDQDRLLEVRAVLKDPSVSVAVISEMWDALVDRYHALPYEKLTGAERVEFEDESDLDVIGDFSDER
ncbi:hypothetical protein [uncultured Cohaesibacter sp.]|uniref:hypothetical protein n=1 Tax=uncultured Cohaesibacter sp. TaxID=1002546 RepID=UPI0029C77E1B|nr:hypothetical protein [uncultured Cohaesibacter sp.]